MKVHYLLGLTTLLFAAQSEKAHEGPSAEQIQMIQEVVEQFRSMNPSQEKSFSAETPIDPVGYGIKLSSYIQEQDYPHLGDISFGDFTVYQSSNLNLDDESRMQTLKKLIPFPFYTSKLVVGKYCSIADQVEILAPTANHPFKNSHSTYLFHFYVARPETVLASIEEWARKGDTIIGNDVWFGRGALIMPGVKIGNGAVIGARSVVTKDVPDYAIVAGVPAKEIGYRFDKKTIAQLQAIAWWDWTSEDILENLGAICGNNIEQLKQSSRKN